MQSIESSDDLLSEEGGGGGGVPIIRSWAVDGSTNAYDTSSTLSCNKPSGVEVGDLLVLIPFNDDSSSIAQFSGNKVNWTFVNTAGSGTSDSHIAMFYKPT